MAPARDLIVLESPNKIASVKRYAGEFGVHAKVTATVGHLMDLPPMAAGPGVDMTTFSPTRLDPRDADAARRIEWLRAIIDEAERIIVATDPDREGEAIAAQLWQWIPSGKAWRATFEEITAAGVARGLAAMRPELNVTAVEAAATRRIVDRLAGWHATALVFEKLRKHKGLSAGRLQSAALRLVVERHREHKNFRPITTFGVRLRLRSASGVEFAAVLLDDEGKPRAFGDRDVAERHSVPERLRVKAVDAEKKSQRPRPPFDAPSWLQVAQKALGLSVKDATAATQTLFEKGFTTYPRTDTVRVSDEAIEWARAEIAYRFGREYVPEKPWVHKDRSGTAQGAHEAIRPTLATNRADIEQRRSGEMAKAYALIEARFLASQAAARIVEQTIVLLQGDSGVYRASGEVELFAGWKRVIATEAAEEENAPTAAEPTEPVADGPPPSLPPVRVGEEIEVVGSEVVAQTTRPKPLFTQASLVAQLKRLGIGRPSTYPAVVPLLLSRGWVLEDHPDPPPAKSARKKIELPVLVPTDTGVDLADFLIEALPGLVDYEFTASLEEALDEVGAGKRSRAEVARAWWERFQAELTRANALPVRMPEQKDLGPCPKCAREGRGGRLRLIRGVSTKNDKPYEFAACDADTKEVQVCGHTSPTRDGELQKLEPCPACRRDMRPATRKTGSHFWVCESHGWFLANRTWRIVRAPSCPKCSRPLVHRERREPKGQFFWACFEHKVFVGSDRFGRIIERRTA